MKDRLSRWGIGPHIAVVTLAYAAIAGAATSRRPGGCRIRLVPSVVLTAIAGSPLIMGLPMLVVSARSVMAAYSTDQLFTAGVSGLVRHPVYSAWVVFILPGLAFLSRSWPQLLMPLVAYTVFKLLIHREDEYLHQGFGEAYLAYRARVNELIRLPRSWYRGHTPRNAPRARNEQQLRR